MVRCSPRKLLGQWPDRLEAFRRSVLLKFLPSTLEPYLPIFFCARKHGFWRWTVSIMFCCSLKAFYFITFWTFITFWKAFLARKTLEKLLKTYIWSNYRHKKQKAINRQHLKIELIFLSDGFFLLNTFRKILENNEAYLTGSNAKRMTEMSETISELTQVYLLVKNGIKWYFCIFVLSLQSIMFADFFYKKMFEFGELRMVSVVVSRSVVFVAVP